MARRPRQAGFTYLWLLLLLAIAAAGLAAITQPISLAVQRDREEELRFRGHAIAHALSTYWAATPGTDKQLPLALQDLVDDRRGPRPLHHLRRVYADPFTGLPDWVLLTEDDGRIAGVHSRSEVPALRVADLPRDARAGATPVSALVFRYSPAPAAAPAASAASAAQPASAAAASSAG
jgi:type II secretory pathway pseudopilin PulG